MTLYDLPVVAPTARPGSAYRAFTLKSLRRIPQVRDLPEDRIRAMEIVARVLPFKANSYVVDELIDWSAVDDDPIFALTFPQKDMLLPHHFERMAAAVERGASASEIRETADSIRWELNPHPAGQLEHNRPTLGDETLEGMQHKYRETVLFFPSHGQTCHAYCSFCFRWPQFVGLDGMKFAMRESSRLVTYLRHHPEVTDVLITGGDPMIMSAKHLAAYLEPLLEAEDTGLRTIRIGTKALSYWPYRFTTDQDADDLLGLFEDVVRAGKHLALMGHFSHPRELETPAAEQAIARIRETGAEIRTQSPILAHINDDADVWAEMWRRQVQLGCIPYYMFVVRDTGAQHYFGTTLVRAWQVFREAYRQVSGVARTVRGPSMSAEPGKVHVLGPAEIDGRKVLALEFLQGRDPDWVLRPFFARYDETAVWIDDLRPAFGERFFFEEA